MLWTGSDWPTLKSDQYVHSRHHNLAYSRLLPTLTLVFNCSDCILTKEFSKLLYQASSQWQISHTLRWLGPIWLSLPLVQPWTVTLPNQSTLILVLTVGYYSPATPDPHPDKALMYSKGTKTCPSQSYTYPGSYEHRWVMDSSLIWHTPGLGHAWLSWLSWSRPPPEPTEKKKKPTGGSSLTSLNNIQTTCSPEGATFLPFILESTSIFLNSINFYIPQSSNDTF